MPAPTLLVCLRHPLTPLALVPMLFRTSTPQVTLVSTIAPAAPSPTKGPLGGPSGTGTGGLPSTAASQQLPPPDSFGAELVAALAASPSSASAASQQLHLAARGGRYGGAGGESLTKDKSVDLSFGPLASSWQSFHRPNWTQQLPISKLLCSGGGTMVRR